jgi:hypothetical protein
MPLPPRPTRPAPITPAAQKALINAFSTYVNMPKKIKNRTLKNMRRLNNVKRTFTNNNVRKNFENWARNKNMNMYASVDNIRKAFLSSNYFRNVKI